jgi:hypothetical protein
MPALPRVVRTVRVRNARAGRRTRAGSLLEHTPGVRADAAQAMTDELPFKVVRSNGTDEVLATRRESADCSRRLLIGSAHVSRGLD